MNYGGFRKQILCLVALLILTFSFTSTGCDGCRQLFSREEKDPLEEPEKKKPEKVEPFKSAELKVLPTDESIVIQGVKPGHWISVQQELTSNKTDFYGELAGMTSGRDQNYPLPLPQSHFRFQTNRAVALVKGQKKTFELTYFPPPTEGRSSQIWMHSNLRLPLGNTNRWTQTQIGSKLKPYQTFFVVLSRRADSYGYLKTLHSIKPPLSEFHLTGIPSDYIVALPTVQQRVPLPSWPLMWTNISYLIWDDFNANNLTSDQQAAMLDWLHWGGQLIISGPSSLDSLKGSFLQDYLPVETKGARPMTDQDAAHLNTWTITSVISKNRSPFQFDAKQPPEIIDFVLRDGGKYIDRTGQLVAERQVGRGRIVTTSFSLTTRQLINWKSFDNFFNNCIMRRPPRKYAYTDENGLSLNWVGNFGNRGVASEPPSPPPANQRFSDLPDNVPDRMPSESLLTSKLRYFSRDAAFNSPVSPEQNTFDSVGYSYGAQSGVAGWNDFSDCSTVSRSALNEAAGISVPDRKFVLAALGLYLVVLVPINWALFRVVGRVEWAWFAVPVLAFTGTYLVVSLAQLDIGFARSRTELAILETQPNYSRGHLTRYTGLYSSLSTNYSLLFEDESAVSLPFATRRASQALSARDIYLERSSKKDEASRLQPFAVNSNSTEMIHSEEFLDIGGVVHLQETASGDESVVNDTDFEFKHVGMIRRVEGQVQIAWIGNLAPQAEVQPNFETAVDNEWFFEEWREPTSNPEETIQLSPLLRLACAPGRLNEGDVLLTGWCEDQMPGLTIQPSASQNTFRTVLVAHLKYGNLPEPQNDINTEMTVKQELEDD